MCEIWVDIRGKWMLWVERRTFADVLRMTPRIKQSWRVIQNGHIIAHSI